MKFNFIKFILSLFVVFFAITVLYQLYVQLYKATATEFAVEISCEETENTVGFFLRDEQVIYTGNSKYFDIVIANGGKVSKNGTIANVYSTENAAKIQSQIRELQTKIDEYKSVASAGNGVNDSSSYVSNVKKDAISISDNIASANVSLAFESASNYLVSIIKHKIANGEITDYSSTVEGLEAQMTELNKQSSSVTKLLTSPVSGYFTYKADGLETSLSMNMTDGFDSSVYEEIKSICENTSSVTNSIGKVVKGSDWRICFKSSADKFEKTTVGSTLYIRIPSLTDSKIKCTVVELKEEGKDVYIVLQSNVVTGDILSQRVCEIEVIIDSYSGLRIDKNAIRKFDGVEGVFVKSNGILKYREIDILYIGSTYAVIKYDSVDKSKVQAYDEVVIKGSDLYNRKVVS